MPTYIYKCERGHEYEEVRGMNEEPRRTICVKPDCGTKLKRVFGTPPITFNGTGFNAKHG